MVRPGLSARNGHAALARRIDQLEVVLQATSEEDEQERFLRAFWQGLPQIVRCLLSSGSADYTRLHELVGVVVKVALNSDSSEAARWQALGATVLHQAHFVLTCRLMREHGSNTWSYGCVERQEATELLFGYMAGSVERHFDAPCHLTGDIGELDDAALVSAWARNVARVQHLDVLEPAALSLRRDNLYRAFYMEPAALAVLAVATKQLELFVAVDCEHEDGHPLPLGKAYIALESLLWSTFWAPR